jgi:hypothetical protein
MRQIVQGCKIRMPLFNAQNPRGIYASDIRLHDGAIGGIGDRVIDLEECLPHKREDLLPGAVNYHGPGMYEKELCHLIMPAGRRSVEGHHMASKPLVVLMRSAAIR